MLLTKCCCCSLRTGCLVIAYIYLVCSFFAFLSSCTAFIHSSFKYPSHIPPLPRTIASASLSAGGVIFASFLLAGIYQKNKKFILVSFIGVIIVQVLGFGLMMESVVYEFMKKNYFSGCTGIAGFLGALGLLIYSLIAVYSYYKAPEE